MAIFGTVVPGETFNFRNRIINGDMRIAQRGTAAVTGSGDFPVDRFIAGNGTDGAFSAQQDTNAPAGFINSFKWTTTTADGTLTTTQGASAIQRIEGTNISDLAWGTANAKTVTLSFWVRSSLTGTFGGALRNSASNRSYPFTYSISVADTWEYKTVTIPGDTTGTWLTTTGVGINVLFGLGAGPDRSGTAGAWNSNNNSSATGAVSVIGTLNATWYITGVQLEVGSVATPFERKPFGTELALCQRYCQQYNASAGGQTYFLVGHVWSTTLCQYAFVPRVALRTTPTITSSGTISNLSGQSAVGLSTLTIDANDSGSAMKVNGNMSSSGYTSGYSCALLINSSGAYIRFDSEL